MNCENCKYWGVPDRSNGANCLELHRVLYVDVIIKKSNNIISFDTPHDFGCNRFDKKEE